MIGWVISSLVGLAAAQETCPDALAAIGSAERDAVSFFLADAQTSLTEAAAGFACARVEKPVLARYWLAQGMVWHLQERDEAVVMSVLAAARRVAPDVFTESLGDELRVLWTVAETDDATPVEVRLRGLKRGDRVLVDGNLNETSLVTVGPHLIQVIRGNQVVYGRLADVPVEGIRLVVEAGTGGPAAAPVGLPELGAPLEWKGGVRDSAGERLSFHEAVVPWSLTLDEGRTLYQRRRRNGRLQGVALATTAVGGWVSYLYAWDLSVGKNQPPATARALLGTGLVLATGGLVWEGTLLARRRGIRKATMGVANQALKPE